MAYCAIEDVKSRCQKLPMSTTSKPTQAEVEAFMEECAAEIDGVLSTLGYEFPISGTKSLLILKKLNADGAAFYAMDAAFSGVSPNASTQGKNYKSEWETGINMLRRGEVILPDASTNTHRQGEPRGSGIASNFIDDDGKSTLAPFITRDQEF